MRRSHRFTAKEHGKTLSLSSSPSTTGSTRTLTVDNTCTDWYQAKPALKDSSSAIISHACEEAKKIFLAELAQDECDQIWVQGTSTIEDVIGEALKSSKKYHSSRPATKTRKWLLRFSETVTHYGSILDVLVQQHPEYVSLAWGTMKFLFSAVINHEELTKQIAKSLAQIGDVMPRTDFTLILYPTDMMQEAVAILYAHIMKFLRKAVLWYKKSKVSHAIGSIFKPWALSWKENVAEISKQSQQIDHLASIASKAELRHMHVKINEQCIQITELAAMIKAQSPQIEQLLREAITTRNLQEEIKIDLSSQKITLQQIQLNQILSDQWLENLPSSGESLQHCFSLQQRKRTHTKLSVTQVLAMDIWASEQKSSVMIIQSKFPNATKDVLLDLVRLIRDASHPIIWTLRFPNYWTTSITCIDIVRMLVLQALQINPSSTCSTSPVTTVHLREAADEEDWLKLLDRVLDGIPDIYLVIDSDLFAFVTKQDKNNATQFLNLLLKLTTKTFVKVFVSSTNVDEEYAQRKWASDQWSTLVIDDIVKSRPERQRKQRLSSKRGRGRQRF